MKTNLLIIILVVLLTAFNSSTFAAITDEELQKGISEECQDTPLELLPVLKENFPQIIIDDSTSNDFTTPHYTWYYGLLDLDRTGEKNYLFVLYTNDFVNVIKLLKREGTAYNLVVDYEPYEPDGTIKIEPLEDGKSAKVSEPYIVNGVLSGFELLDINNDGIPEIKIQQRGNCASSNEPVLQWDGTTLNFITPEETTWTSPAYIDINRDGLLDIASFFVYAVGETTEPDVIPAESSEVKIYLFNGSEYIFNKSIPNEEGHSAFLMDSTVINPKQWYFSWATTPQSEYIKATLSAIDESHAVTEIDPASVRMEDRVLPVRTWIKNDKFFAEFDKREAMTYLLKAPRLKPLQGGDKINIIISALLQSGQYVSGSSEIELVDTLPFKEFSLKHWRISWSQGKRDKNKFQLSGRIDLPGDYTLDRLQKKGIVTIAIEKKDSAPFSQTAVLDFKQHGPIWQYKAPKAQNGTEPLDIEKMLIFWQPEGLEDKPDKQGHAGKGPGKRKRAGWFMIQGNINISDTDQAALLPKAALTLNIPVENITTAGALESREEVEFKVPKNLWSYNAVPHRRWQDWQESWWEKVKED